MSTLQLGIHGLKLGHMLYKRSCNPRRNQIPTNPTQKLGLMVAVEPENSVLVRKSLTNGNSPIGVPSLKLTDIAWKRRFLLETTIFRGDVSFRECSCWGICWWSVVIFWDLHTSPTASCSDQLLVSGNTRRSVPESTIYKVTTSTPAQDQISILKKNPGILSSTKHKNQKKCGCQKIRQKIGCFCWIFVGKSRVS